MGREAVQIRADRARFAVPPATGKYENTIFMHEIAPHSISRAGSLGSMI